MKLVEQHLIAKGDPRYAAIDAAAFASKNLYNPESPRSLTTSRRRRAGTS